MGDQASLLFALDASRALGDSIAFELGVELAAHEEREFDGGEHKSRPKVSVRGRSVMVVQSLCGDAEASANDKLCRLLFFIGTLKDGAASSVTVLAPYLCYSRKDRRTKAQDPVTTRYVAQLFEAVGTDRLITVDVHNLAAFQNAFRCPTEHIDARQVFADHLISRVRGESTVVVSPDLGGAKRAERFRVALQRRAGHPVGLAFVEKHRSRGELSGGLAVYGDVAGKDAIIYDDLISSGGTLRRAAGQCRVQGADRVYAVATHGAFSAGAELLFSDPAIDEVVISDTIEQPHRAGCSPTVVTLAPLLAEAIDRITHHGSSVELLATEP